MKTFALGGAKVALAGFVLLLAACGGGGGGGGGGAPDLSTVPGLSVSPTSLSFTAVQAGPLPASQNINVTITHPQAVAIIAGFPTGVTPPSWLSQNPNVFSCTPSLSSCTLTAVIITTNLAPGTYTTTIRFVIGNAAQQALALRDVQISYTVQPLTGLSATPTSLSFAQLQGGPAPGSQTLGISELGGTSYAWNAAILYQSGSGWLSINGGASASGATLPTTLTVSATPQAALGTLNATIRITGNNNTLDVPVSYTLSQSQVTRSATALTFNALRLGPSPTTQDITLTTQSSLSVPYTTAVTYGASATGWLNAPASGTAPGTLTVGVNTTTLAPGSHTATLTINTTSQSLPVTVTYVVAEPTLTRSPAGLTFNVAAGGALPASQDVTLSTQQSVSLGYSASISYGAGATGWLSVTPTSGTAPGTATVSVNTTALAPATYSATVSFTTAAQTVSVGVSYVVTPSTLTLGPSSASFTIDTTSVAAALSQNIAVGSTGVALNWTASSSQSWVSVSPTSGLSGSSVTLSLVPAELDTLDAGTRSATITFSYTPPGQAATTAPLSVSLNLQIPKVTSVNPYVAISSTNLEVILRGTGFSNPGGTAVSFDGTPGTSPTLVSDTELRVTHPSLAVGSYRVSVPNQLGNANIVRSTANLVVVDAPAYVAATLAYPAPSPTVILRVPLNIVYDAERKAVLVGVRYAASAPVPSPEILRYTFSGSAWSITPASVQVADMHDVALTLDGKKVLATSGKAVSAFNSATLAAGGSTSAELIVSDFLNRIALANDDNSVVTTDLNGSGFTDAWSYSTSSASLTQFPFVNNRFSRATSSGSADGSRVVLVQSGVSPEQPVYQYSASTSTLSATGRSTSTNTRPSLSRNGTLILIQGTLHNANFQSLGSIADPAAVLSPDGTKAYGVSGGALHTYNMNTFLEIGTGIALPSDPGANPVIAVSPDGGNVFIAGSDAIVVVPVP